MNNNFFSLLLLVTTRLFYNLYGDTPVSSGVWRGNVCPTPFYTFNLHKEKFGINKPKHPCTVCPPPPQLAPPLSHTHTISVCVCVCARTRSTKSSTLPRSLSCWILPSPSFLESWKTDASSLWFCCSMPSPETTIANPKDRCCQRRCDAAHHLLRQE
jgi:hypothetical protein